MKFPISELHSGKSPPQCSSSAKKVLVALLVLALTPVLLAAIPLYLFVTGMHLNVLLSQELEISTRVSKAIEGVDRRCDVFRGKWVHHPSAVYYTNVTCALIIDQHNCLKFGRPNTEFLKWQW